MAVRRSPARRRRRALLRAVRLLLLAGVLMAAFLFLRSDLFLVRQVEVQGLVRLTADEVRDQAGLGEQRLIWQINPWSMRRRLLAHPRVASAAVRVALPNGVTIVVSERLPLAVIPSGERYWEVSQDGRILGSSTRLVDPELPLVTGVPEPAQAGEQAGDPATWRALAVAAALGRQGRQAVSEIHVAPSGEIVLITVEGIPAYLGLEDEWQEKVGIFLGILDDLRGKRQAAAYIDLRSSQRPVVRLR